MSTNDTRTMVQHNAARPAFGAQLGAKAFVVVVSALQFGLLHVLGEQAATIGRAKECQVRLDDPAVSNLHCKISADAAGGHVIEDCGSTNGTLVNGRHIVVPVALSYGDRISVGSTILRFYMEEIPDRPPA